MGKISNGARFAHASLMVDDAMQSAAFLTETLGFQIAFGPVEIGEALAEMTGTPCGDTQLIQLEHANDHITVEVISSHGVAGAGQNRPPLAHIAFVVPNLAAALAHSEEAGAVLLGAVTSFAEGRSAYLREPGGAIIELEELFE